MDLSKCICEGFYKPAHCPVHGATSSEAFRKLLYHPESNCYIEYRNREEYEKEIGEMIGCGRGEPLDDVSDMTHHEIEFLKRKRKGLRG